MKFLNEIKKSHHRHLLEKQLLKYKHLINGKILDIGSKTRRYDHLFQGEVVAIDINPDPKLNIIKGDLINLEFDSDSFDSVICIEVFEQLEPDEFKVGISEIIRVLKKKGKAIITIPFFMLDCRDNLRFTFVYLSNYLKQLNNINFRIIKIGNKYTAIYDALKNSLIQRKPNILKAISLISLILIFYLILKIFSLEKKVDLFYSGCFIICTKI